MSTKNWKPLICLDLTPSNITLHAYASLPSQLKGLYNDFPITLASKTISIDVEVVDAQLNYKNLLGHSFMYAMNEVSSSIFHIMMFPRDWKVVTIDQIVYHPPGASNSLENVISAVNNATFLNQTIGP